MKIPCDIHYGAWEEIRRNLFFIYYEMKCGKFTHLERKNRLDGIFDWISDIWKKISKQ